MVEKECVFRFIHIIWGLEHWVQLFARLCVSWNSTISVCHLWPSPVCPGGQQPHTEVHSKSIRHLFKLQIHNTAKKKQKKNTALWMCVCGSCGDWPNLVRLITHTGASKQLWQELAETQLTGHKYTNSDARSPYRSCWDSVCCVLPDLSVSLSVWVVVFPFLFSGRPSPRSLAICSPCCGTRRSPPAACIQKWWQKLPIGVKARLEKWLGQFFLDTSVVQEVVCFVILLSQCVFCGWRFT